MAVKVNAAAVAYAEKLIKASEFESFDGDWQEEKPTKDELVNFLNSHNMKEYALWFLGQNDQVPSENKEHYEYPHGDFKVVHRCALEHSLKEAEKRGHHDIAAAAKKLIKLLDEQD